MYTEPPPPHSPFSRCLSVVPCPTTNQFYPEKIESAEEHSPIVQQFEISDPIAKACWHKDGTLIYPKRAGTCELQPSSRAAPFKSCDLSNDEGFGCEAFGAQLRVDMKGGAPCCMPTV